MPETENGPLPPLEQTLNVYQKPYPKDANVTGVETEGPAHAGPYRGAIDFLMPLGTPVLSPLDGTVVKVVDVNSRYGPTEEFVDDLNFITISHANGEFSQVCHLEKGSAKVRKGDAVRAGQEIAATGNSGWMTQPHLHFLVFRLNDDESSFHGLEPRFSE